MPTSTRRTLRFASPLLLVLLATLLSALLSCRAPQPELDPATYSYPPCPGSIDWCLERLRCTVDEAKQCELCSCPANPAAEESSRIDALKKTP